MKERLDRIDRHILARLQEDGRRSNKELAAQVGLAPSSCAERVRKLREAGHMRGIHAEVDPRALGIQLQAMVFVQLERHAATIMSQFQEQVCAHPEVLAVYHVAGQHDFLVHVVARDTDHLQQLILMLSQPAVRHVQTALIFSHQRTHVLPDLTDDGS